jgi:uncharacterized protein YkwD
MLRQMAVGIAYFVGVSMLGLLGTSVSVAADGKVPASFTNNTDGDFELFWLDTSKGKEVSYGVVRKGESKDQDTFNGHVWVIRSPRGEELGRYTVKTTPGSAAAFALAGRQADLLRKDKPAQDTQDKPGQDTVATAKEVLRYVNEERKQRGLAALVEDPALTSAAQKYARFLAQNHNKLVNGPQKLSDSDARAKTLSHTLDGKDQVQRAKAEGFPHMDVGEVAHAGPYVNAEQAVRAPDGVGWLHSRAGHRDAILSSKYTLAGVGVAYTESGVPYYIMKLAAPR